MKERISRARSFVDDANIGTARGPSRGGGPGDDSVIGPALEAGKAQAAVVGADLLSFGAEVDTPWRQDLANSALLAQLVARQRVPESHRLFDWYDVYFDTLANIGWAVEDRSFAIYNTSGRDFDAHEAVLKVAAGLMGPATTTLALLTTTLQALQSMGADSPWIKLYEQEACHTETARFQIGVAEQSGGDTLSVSTMAFGLEANTRMTQVLFVRHRASDATLRHCAGRVAIDTVVLGGVRDALRQKLTSHAQSFIKALPDLDLPPAGSPTRGRSR